jgi:prepilin signal peptidase PulO-like enzyme (type II secretory pathway)
MPTPNEPTKPSRGTCPNCGSKNVRHAKVPDEEPVVVRRRTCRDCGTEFSPAVSLLWVLVTVPLALLILWFAVWGAFINDRGDVGTVQSLAWVAFLGTLCLMLATVQILKQREPKIHHTPQKAREPKPWDKPQGGAE